LCSEINGFTDFAPSPSIEIASTATPLFLYSSSCPLHGGHFTYADVSPGRQSADHTLLRNSSARALPPAAHRQIDAGMCTGLQLAVSPSGSAGSPAADAENTADA